MSDFWIELAETEHGEQLMNQARFDSYRPEEVETDEWIQVLGNDVCNYHHMQHTAELTQWYMDESKALGQPFADEERELLELTAWTHDFSESLLGDVPDPEKKNDMFEQAEEYMAHVAVMSSVTDFPYVISRPVLDVMQGRDRVSKDWRAIEMIGYHQTAVKAGEEAAYISDWQVALGLEFKTARKLYHHLVQMHDEVAPRVLEGLEEFADLPVVSKYLLDQWAIQFDNASNGSMREHARGKMNHIISLR